MGECGRTTTIAPPTLAADKVTGETSRVEIPGPPWSETSQLSSRPEDMTAFAYPEMTETSPSSKVAVAVALSREFLPSRAITARLPRRREILKYSLSRARSFDEVLTSMSRSMREATPSSISKVDDGSKEVTRLP